MANTPFKMKYTNGKKADTSAFPFSTRVNNPTPMVPSGDGAEDAITAKIDEKVEEKVNEVVNQQTSEGLV